MPGRWSSEESWKNKMRGYNLRKALKVISLLKQQYGTGIYSGKSPFYTLIFTVLSARNRDSQTEKAAVSLFQRFPTMESLAEAKVKDIESTIRFIGLFHQKALRVKRISQLLLEKYNGKVPDFMDDLLELPGVGRKTASCVLIYAFHKPAIAVDTHVHRISNRLGFVKTKTPKQTETALKRLLPQKNWIDINELLVKHGQTICRPISPFCNQCPVNEFCKYYCTTFVRPRVKIKE
jgi:endonuclease III